MVSKTKTTTKKEKTTPVKKVTKSEPQKKKAYKQKLKKNTQITNTLVYDAKKMMRFEEVYEGEVPNQKVPTKFYKFNIYTENEDGTIGDLILEFDELMCFGVAMNTDQKTGDPAGYSMSISMMNKEKSGTHISVITLTDEHGDYETDIDRLDNGMSDPNRYTTSRLKKLFANDKREV